MSSTLANVKFVALKSCFANLPTHRVRALGNTNAVVQDVIIEVQHASPGRANSSGKGGDMQSAFLGWTGMASTSGSSSRDRGSGSQRQTETPVIEIDVTFGNVLGLVDGQQVNVFVHLNPVLAHTVNIEPLTSADWEIIELHAAFLESNLLFQVRAIPNPAYAASPVAKSRQLHPLTIHLSPTSTANVLITSIVPPQAANVPFVKIAPDAEVIVAPKVRPSQAYNERAASRSLASKQSISGRSRGQPRSSQPETRSSRTVFLRAVDKSVIPSYFVSQKEIEVNADAALTVWLDEDLIYQLGMRKSEYVSVSVQGFRSDRAATDPQRSQLFAALEESGAGQPASTLVAKLGTWPDAPDIHHAALSPLLCSSLDITGCVGQMIRLSVASPKVPKNQVERFDIYPFISSDERSESLKIKNKHDNFVKDITRDIRAEYAKFSSTRNLLDGPLTDGQLLPAVPSLWPGAILRLRSDGSDSSTSFVTPQWMLASDIKGQFSVQAEIPNLSSTSEAFVDDVRLLKEPLTLVGIEEILDQSTESVLEGSSILLTGGTGAGKSGLCATLSHTLRSEELVHVSSVSCIKLKSDEMRVSQLQEIVLQVLQRAALGSKFGGRALIIFDDLDQLCPAETELQTVDNARSRHISEMLASQIQHYLDENPRICILATAQHKDSAHKTIIGGNIFEETVSIKAPDKDGRRQVLDALTHPKARHQRGEKGKVNGSADTLERKAEDDGALWMNVESSRSALGQAVMIDKSAELDLLDIAGQTDGYMPGDLVQLVSRAKNEAIIRTLDNTIKDEALILMQADFTNALKGYTPSSLRNITLQTSQTTFSSIGGLTQTRRTLLETLQYPTTYAPIFAQCPLRLRSGLLLYGYPGCGKTMLASAVAGECNLNFISVKGPEILNKYIGASEKAVRDLFERAEAAKPCVLFFDEFDAIAPKRGHDSTGVTDRVVNQMLVQMDGAEGLSGVYVLAATSRPDLIDSALLRPGRLDKSLLCGMPGLEDRVDILMALAKGLSVEKGVMDWERGGPGGKGRNFREVAERTEGYTGADLQAVVYNAHLEAVHESLGDIDGEREGKKGDGRQKVNGVNKGRSGAALDILQFRLGQAPNGSADGRIPKTRAQEAAEYAAVVSKLDELKLAKKKEKQDRRGGRHEDVKPLVNGAEKGPSATDVMIQWRHIESSLATTRSSISDTERRRLQRIYHEFVVGRNGEMPDGQGGSEIGGRSSLM